MLSENEQTSDLKQLFRFVSANLKSLGLYTIAGGLLAICLTLFIEKEFKSYGVVYPPSSTSIENSIDFPNFGYDVEADRLIQLLESREIRDSVAKQFHLATYFKLDTTTVDWKDRLIKLYYKNIKLERTTSMAVVISARTNNPEMSANIVNYIIRVADNYREHLYKRNLSAAYHQAEIEYNTQKSIVDTAQNYLLNHLKENNLSSLLLLYSDAQLNLTLEKLNVQTLQPSAAAIGAEILHYKSLYEVLKEAKSRYIKLRKTMLNPIPKIFVVSYAEPQYRKISPSFTINALLGAALGLILSMVLILLKRSAENH